jgi:hypothetical protein
MSSLHYFYSISNFSSGTVEQWNTPWLARAFGNITSRLSLLWSAHRQNTASCITTTMPFGMLARKRFAVAFSRLFQPTS